MSIMELNKKLAIVVVSCDKYGDLWDDVFNLLDIHWKDRPYKTYLATDSKPFEREGVEVLYFGNIRQWMVCTRKAVEKIDTPYVLFLMEDYFVIKDIDTSIIEEDIRFMEEHHVDFMNLHQKPYFLNEEESKFLNPSVRTIPNNTRYGLDTAGAIWRKDFFLEQLNREDGDAWRFEAILVEDSKSPEGLPGKLCFDTRTPLNLCPGEVVRLGKFTLDTVKIIESTGYKIKSNRARMTKWEFYKDKLKGRLASVKHGRKMLKKIGKRFGFVFFTED